VHPEPSEVDSFFFILEDTTLSSLNFNEIGKVAATGSMPLAALYERID
jgi:hypothetical protein